MSVNKCILVGRLGQDPESRAFPDGGTICNLSIATSERWKDKQTGEQKERTEWHRIVLRNKLGEIAQQYLRKGSQVYIEGRIQHRKYQDGNGQEKYVTEIIGNVMNMLDSKSDASPSANQQANNQFEQPAQPPQQQQPAAAGDYPLDDDIPF